MLTDSEREWLNNRDNHAEHFCRWCDEWENCLGEFDAIFCPSWPHKVQLLEAAEFESRVEAKLAKMMFKQNRYPPCRGGFPPLGCMREWGILTGSMAVHCEDCVLREVRLQVEEEIDG